MVVKQPKDSKNSLPPEIPGWSWGAFILTWIWGIGNRVWISFLMLIPLVNIVMPFVLGFKGRQWAWEKGGWRDVEHFKRVQRLWSIWGLIVLALQILVVALILIYGSGSQYETLDQLTHRIASYEEVKEVLGDPIQHHGSLKGTLEIEGTAGLIHGSLQLEGSKGNGIAHIKAYNIDDSWNFIELDIALEEPDMVIELVNLPEQSSQRRNYEVFRRGTEIFSKSWKESTEIDSLRVAAEGGDIQSQYMMGALYKAGEGVELDPEAAFHWFKAAADQGDAPSQYVLGGMYEDGEGVEANLEKAFKWYMRAAQLGDPQAQHVIGTFFEEGKGVPPNAEEAFKWYLQAAKQGYAPSEYMVGVYYDNGDCVEVNLDEAFKWYKLAAAQEDTYGQFMLATFYEKGRGEVSKDSETAFKWFEKSAERGNPYAQQALGYKYHEGAGVPQDESKALYWFRKAQDQGLLQQDDIPVELEGKL